MQVTHDEKKIKMKDNLFKILEMLDETLKSHGILQKDSKSDLMADPSKTLNNRVILSYLEKFIGMKLGANERTFKKLVLELDPPAYVMWECYLTYLNTLLEPIGKGPRETEEEVIESRFVLVREIFKRLVSVALCKDMSPQKDGDVLIKVLQTFIDIINKSEILKDSEISNLFRNTERFRIAVATTHDEWIGYIRSMVDIIKLLHAPETAFKDTLEYLKAIKFVIARQLIARLNPHVSPDDLSDDWILNTLDKCERQKKGQMIDSRDQRQDSVSQSWSATKLSNQQKIIISKVDSKEREKVEQLYELLCKTNILFEIASCLNLTETYSGWVLLITGTIEVNNLIEEINKHQKQCDLILNLDQKDSLLQSKAGQGLIKHSAVRTSQLKFRAVKSYESLRIITDKEVVGRLIRTMSMNFERLLDLQKLLANKIVNEDIGLLVNSDDEGYLDRLKMKMDAYLRMSESYVQDQKMDAALNALVDAAETVKTIAPPSNLLDPQNVPSREEHRFIQEKLKQIEDRHKRIDLDKVSKDSRFKYDKNIVEMIDCVNESATNTHRNDALIMEGRRPLNNDTEEVGSYVDGIVTKMVSERRLKTGIAAAATVVIITGLVGGLTGGLGAPLGLTIGLTAGTAIGGGLTVALVTATVEVISNLKKIEEIAAQGGNIDEFLYDYLAKSDLAFPIAMTFASTATYAYNLGRLGVSRPVCYELFQTGFLQGLGKEIYNHVDREEFRQGISGISIESSLSPIMLEKIVRYRKTPQFCRNALNYNSKVNIEIERRIKVYREKVIPINQQQVAQEPTSQTRYSLTALSESMEEAGKKQYQFALSRPTPTRILINFVGKGVKEPTAKQLSTLQTLEEKLGECIRDHVPSVKLRKDEEADALFLEGSDVKDINTAARLLSEASNQNLAGKYSNHSFFKPVVRSNTSSATLTTTTTTTRSTVTTTTVTTDNQHTASHEPEEETISCTLQ